MAYFRSSDLGEPHSAYVAWVDLMGCQNLMTGPIRIAAQAVYKLHVAALEAQMSSVRIYPVMDGFYAVSEGDSDLKLFLQQVYSNVLRDLVRDSGKPGFQYLVRGAIAHGDVYHGRDLPKAASTILAANPQYKSSLVIGLPIILAHRAEHDAPPFGVAVDRSALIAPEIQGARLWWRWFPEAQRTEILRELLLYFQGARQFLTDQYPIARIDAHRQLVIEYFGTG